MLIEISKIPPEGLDVAVPEAPLDLGEPSDVWAGPATVGAAVRFDRSGRGVVVSGTFQGGIQLVCSRCLEPFPFTTKESFRLYFETARPGRPEEEFELTDDELDVTFVEEGRIDTDSLLRENVLLSLPLQPLCREDCRGLCQYCGTNLNLGGCPCQEPRRDPRLEPLRKLL
jgi:DUF177 domain-containing protein